MHLPRLFPVLISLLLAATAKIVHANELLNDSPPPLPERPRPCGPAGPHTPSCAADTYELWFPSPIQGGECPHNYMERAPLVPGEVHCRDIAQAPTGLDIECEPFGSEQLHCWVWPVGRELLYRTFPEPLGFGQMGISYGWNFHPGLTGELLQPLGASVLVSCANEGIGGGGVLEVVLTWPVGLRASQAIYIDCGD